MKRILFFALWVAAAGIVAGCGEDDQWSKLKARCLDFNETLERCFVNPDDYERSVAACDNFDKPNTGAEYKDLFLCKEECVDNATPTTECTCLLSHDNGGPDC